MKAKYILIVMFTFFYQIIMACPVCEKQQPAITQGLTHGAGPASNWDWVIIGIMTAFTLFTLIYSLKYLVKPGEKSNNHIKQSILRS